MTPVDDGLRANRAVIAIVKQRRKRHPGGKSIGIRETLPWNFFMLRSDHFRDAPAGDELRVGADFIGGGIGPGGRPERESGCITSCSHGCERSTASSFRTVPFPLALSPFQGKKKLM